MKKHKQIEQNLYSFWDEEYDRLNKEMGYMQNVQSLFSEGYITTLYRMQTQIEKELRKE